MPIYLTPIVGDGTDTNPFRPAVWNKVLTEAWINLLPAGWGILSLPTSSADPRLIQLADLADDILPRSVRTRLQNALSLTLGQTRLKDVVAELLMVHGREDGTRWRLLPPNRLARRYEIWLNGLLWSQPVIAGGSSVSETWAGADGTTLTQAAGRDQNWTETLNNSQVVSNKLEPVTTGASCECRCDTGVTTDVHKATATVTIATRNAGETRVGGVACQFAAAARTFYATTFTRNATPDDSRDLFKRVAGALTSLAGDTTDQGAAATVCVVESNGATITGTIGATTFGPVTDPSPITGNTQGGTILRQPPAGSPPNLDDWTLEDLVIAGAPPGHGMLLSGFRNAVLQRV